MGLLKLIRKAGKLFRGEAATPQIVMACLLGLLVGMTVGFNMTVVILVLLVLLLNANLFLVAMALLAGKFLALVLAPVTFRIGYVVIHDLGLEGLFRTAGDTPVLALMNLHNYCQTGGMLLALPLGLVGGFVVARMVLALRRRHQEAADKGGAYGKLVGNAFSRFVARVLFGKVKAAPAEAAKKRPPILRKGGVILMCVVAVLMVAGQFLLSGAVVRSKLEDSLSQAVGAEVNIAEVDFSLFSGRLAMRGLQITDPDKPTHNAVQADRLGLQLSVADLLAGRFSADLMEVSGLKTNQQRKAPGRVAKADKKDEAQKDELPDDLVTDYFAKGQEYRKYLPQLKKARQWMEKRQAEQQSQEAGEPPAATLDEQLAQAKRTGLMSLSADSVLSKHPLWTIRKLKIDSIERPGSPAVYRIAGEELSSHPSRNKHPMRLRLEGLDEMVIEVVLHYEPGGKTNTFSLHVPRMELNEGILGEKSSVQVQDGWASLRCDGTFGADALDLPVLIHLHDLKARPREGRSMLGLDGETAGKMLDHASEWPLEIAVRGTPDAPRLEVDNKKVLASLREALAAAGKNMLAEQAGKQLEKLGLPDADGKAALKQVGDLLGRDKDASAQSTDKDKAADGKAVLKQVGDLLGRKKNAATQPTDKDKDSDAKKPTGLLDGLLR